MSDLSSAPRGELLKLIFDLIEENQALKAQIAELQKRLGDKSPPAKLAIPSFVKPNKKRKRKESRKARSHGYARSTDIPTKTMFHSFDICPSCGSHELGKPSVGYERQVIDIPVPQVEITKHVVFKRLCCHCQKRIMPKVDFGSLTLGASRVGVNTMSVVSVLREKMRLPVNVIQWYLKSLYGLHLSQGEIISILAKVSSLGKNQYDELLEHVRDSSTVHADETGGRESGQNGYWWNFSNNKYQYLLYRKSRAGKVVSEVLGEDGQRFNGVLISDFYTAYNVHTGFHQRCWVHLLRDIKNLKEEVKKHPPLNKWAKRVKQIYEEARQYSGPNPALPLGLQAQERINKEAYFKEKLKRVCEPYLYRKTPMSTLCGRCISFLPELFTFVRFPNISSDNNPAERALRHLVVARKISGGTRSEKGSEVKAILGSLFGTWRLQNLNPFEQTRLLLVNASCQ